MTLQQRGVLELQKQMNWTAYQYPNKDLTDWTGSLFHQLVFSNLAPGTTGSTDSAGMYSPTTSMSICRSCSKNPPPSQGYVHRTFAAVFMDVYASTGSIALALQSLFTLGAQSIYYDLLPDFLVNDSAEALFFITTLIPTYFSGLLVV
jgi:hypothetical protein